jgi:LPXTG-site transpeptidase (sortase) family protein
VPGAAGNAVLAAHVDWAGAPGAFYELRHASPGNLVQVTSPEGLSVTYRVDTVELVEARVADIPGIVGGREGRSTLTLITCGGPFNRSIGEYEHRVIVRASLVPSVPPSDA